MPRNLIKINTKCKYAELHTHFVPKISANPLLAVYHLGELYRTSGYKNHKFHQNINITIRHIESHLTEENVQMLCLATLNIEDDRINLENTYEKMDRRAFEHAVLRQPRLIDLIRIEDLKILSTKPGFVREAMVALIRKHLKKSGEQDPFSDKDFQYSKMHMGDAEINHAYVARFIASCDSLPIENIIELGSTPEIASKFLLDFSQSNYRFSIGAKFVEKFDTLAPAIATDWGNATQNRRLLEDEAAELRGVLPELQAQLPEFRNVIIDNHVGPTQRPIEPPAGPGIDYDYYFWIFGAGCVVVAGVGAVGPAAALAAAKAGINSALALAAGATGPAAAAATGPAAAVAATGPAAAVVTMRAVAKVVKVANLAVKALAALGIFRYFAGSEGPAEPAAAVLVAPAAAPVPAAPAAAPVSVARAAAPVLVARAAAPAPVARAAAPVLVAPAAANARMKR
jgi:hypothetical protein